MSKSDFRLFINESHGIKSAQGSGSVLDGNQCFHFLLNPPSWVAYHARDAEEVPKKAVYPTTQSP